jgi:hypothetical protein
MKKFLYLLLAIAMLATFGCTGDENSYSVTNPNPNQFQPKGTVSGVLVDACTNEPIANADVYIMDKKATTNSVGMFTIKKVPANTGVGEESSSGGTPLLSNGLYSWQTYNVVIDMSKVNAARAKILGAKLYPSIAYHTVNVTYTSLGETSTQTTNTTTSTNHDTPVDGFVANIKPMVGKLSATLNLEAVNGNNGSPLSGATVQLISLSPFDGINTPNNVTGNLVNTIATATTGTDGKVSFTNVEAKHIFYAKVTWTNPPNGHVWTGRAELDIDDDADGTIDLPVVWTECDNTVTNFYTVGPNAPIKCFDSQEDDIHPYVESVTPANLSDIAPSDTTQVVFTFSEVLQPTQYLLNTTEASSTIDGIWKDTVVRYLGAKSKAWGSNMAFTMAWDSTTAPKVLTITLATSGSAKYTVDIDNAVEKLFDTNGNAGIIPDVNMVDVNFTTGGGLDVTAPVISRQGVTNNVEWLPVTNAYAYRVYVAPIRDGVTGPYVFFEQTAFTMSDLSTLAWNDGETKLSYSVIVKTINTDLDESAASNAVVVDDKTRPTAAIVSHDTLNYAFAANETLTRTVVVDFSEVMDKPSVLAASGWTIAITAANPITYAVTNVVVTYPGNYTRATITYTVTNGATAQTPTAATLSTTAKDLNGNAMAAALVGALIP